MAGIERKVPFEQVKARMNWQQGEHITLVGPTGQGKTTLAMELMPLRTYPVVCATKPTGKDDTLLKFRKRDGYKLITEWPPTTIDTRLMFWPKLKVPEDQANQYRQIRLMLRNVFTRGSYAVLLDELRYVTETLGLKSEVELLWQQGRSLGVSVVACAQRPSHVPLLAYDQATHLFFWKDNDKRNVQRMGGLGAFDSKTIEGIIPHLERHEALYLNTRDGVMMTTSTGPARSV